MHNFPKFAAIATATILFAACQSVPETSGTVAQVEPAENQVVEVTQKEKSFKFVNRNPGTKVCKTVTESGSRLQTEKLCKSEAEWAARSDSASNGLREMQSSFNGAESP